MEGQGKGWLLIIGGAEDKTGRCEILSRFAALAGGQQSRVALITAAAENPSEVGTEYQRLFTRLGIGEILLLDVSSREQANDPDVIDKLRDLTGVFFTGGDQLRITTLIGGTLLDSFLHQAYESGVVFAGTSAGASVMSETMIAEGNSDDTPKKNTVKMAPGMGLLREVVVDQHFAQRGRLGRLLTAVAQNPHILGIGIDEDTAVVMSPDAVFEVIGSGTVTILDGRSIGSTNVTESGPAQPLALTDVLLHILPTGYRFDLKTRRPF
jgi:cyanophycinase